MKDEKKVLVIRQMSINIGKGDEFSIEQFINKSGLRDIYGEEDMDDVYRAVTALLKMFERKDYVRVIEGRKEQAVGNNNKKNHSLRGRPAKIYQSLINLSIQVTPEKLILDCGHEFHGDTRPDFCPKCGKSA